MADFVSGFWNSYVMVLVFLSIAFCVFVLVTNTTKRPTGPAELHDHVWDETLQEYNNPLPRWWMYMFWITIIFAIAYLAMYPGFGNNQGKLGWSAVGQWEAEQKAAAEKYGPIFAKYRGMDLNAVAADKDANAMGQRLFLTYCAQCHGADAKGAKGFPNLTDNDWLYGGEPDTIKTTVLGGRQGMMPPFGPALGADGVKDVANFVRSLSGLAHDSLRAQRGKEIFAQNCAACHGPEAKGTPAVGAPNLTDKTWLYGSAEATIIETVTNGRTNRMPAFQEFLGEDKVHLLAAYVLSLSKNAAPAEEKK
ncbi:MAG TPA: cytochrome-c oxidase, cbb3-type subunit III [Zoogloea sp.]|uniref:cytochrome-c oxidase, cbb3-type subunit III n=1 Tax=Zoogloea sp. TaxID=49181 RepID=UPI002B715CED|nr:cytochrome-c oxidase, cbb3-type subunit III [Zoogloea sp.]HMV19392.1 cytochrome-c oxidase, cbb3-type subunit III [Rhodocyclaceae bacterium]HND26005.1 cytochrome-c oxidase, cbb3-type subunit III [Rhodocyclaceae bacterium]HNE44496.1 cytochrome-c oxidase, cbb3-type subunit III [Rhodocyclaceae bacterium]HNI49768.1 cytochrome-c oxidase, cbb3-type subunit III [Zoogloea sp.]HNO89081.1 cytochrome-c oxidase, cbb3-type subunit III [Rhodocyclaceae bacterium]